MTNPITRRTRPALIIAILALFATPALAAPPESILFCSRYPAQCNADILPSKFVQLTSAIWSIMNKVNNDVNDKITPDPFKNGYDWSLETNKGNCNDYVVQKRKALHDAGFPFKSLLMTAVIAPRRVGHMVLVVRTTEGDYVLDNLRKNIVKMSETCYKVINQQSEHDPREWRR